MKRKLTPDELNQLELEGIDTSNYKGELYDFPDPEPTSTALGAGGRAALANALPATAGAAGFAGGMALAAPFAPATGGLSFLVPIASGLISGALASGATKYAQDAILPQSVEDRLALDAAEHPVASRAGAIGANLLTMRPSLSVTRDAFKGLAQLPAASVAGSGAMQTLNPVYRNALANVGMGAGISGAVEGGRQLATGELNLGDLATETLVGAALNKPTALGAKVMRLPAHSTGERPIDNPEALRNAQGTVQPPQNDAHVRTFRESLAAQRQFNDAAIGMAEESMANQAKLSAELQAVKQSQAETKAALDDAMGALLDRGYVDTARQQKLADYAKMQEIDRAEQARNAELELKTRDPLSKLEVTPEESAQDLEMRRIEASLSGEERPRYSTERAVTPTEQTLSEEMAQQKIPTAPSKGFNQAVDDLLQRKNIGVEENRNIEDKGMMRPGSDERKIFVNPEKETVDTRAHEGLHYEIQEIEKDASTGNARAKSFIDSLYSKQSEILAEYNKKLAETGQPPVDAHEFATTEQGARFVQEQLNTKREGPWRKWWNDTKALWNQRFGKNPSVDDLQRALNYRFVNREGMGTVGKFGPLGETGTVRPMPTVGKSEEERKSKANPLEGYRKVNVVKQDGSREEVYFNDKYYDMGEMGKFASIAKILPNGEITHGVTKKGEVLEEAKDRFTRNSEDNRGLLRDTVLHTVRNEEDIPNIINNGLRRGTNVSLNGDQPNQSLGSGVTLVYNKGDIVASEKGYNPGDGLVDRQTKVKPKAILVEVGDLIEQPPITSEQALDRLNKLQALQEQERNNTKEAQKKITENYNKILDSIIVNKVGDKLTLSTLDQQSTVRGVYNPLKGYSPEQTNTKPGITKEYSVTEFDGKPWLVHNRTRMSVKDANSIVQRAKEHFAETYLNEKNPLDYNRLTSDWRKSRKYDDEIDQLFEQLDKMEREGVNSLPGFTADDYIKSLKLPNDIPVYSYIADEDGNATNIRPTSRNSKEGRGLEREDKRSFMTSSERVLRTIKGAQSSEQVLNTLRNKIPPAEWDVLQKGGIEAAFANRKVTPDEIAKWVQENGPRAEVHSYGMEGKVSEAQRRYAALTHAIDSWKSAWTKEQKDWYENRSWLPENENDVKELSYTAQQQGLSKPQADSVAEYLYLRNQGASKVHGSGPKATSYYSTVSALPTDQPMPEWTTTKSDKNVQRVDVVIPGNQKKWDAEIDDINLNLTQGEVDRRAGFNLWTPDGLHENLPNTIGWAMIQYKTGPNGEKIAVIPELQARWAQEKRKYWEVYKKEKDRLLNDPAQYGHIEDKAEVERLAEKAAHDEAGIGLQYRPGMDHTLADNPYRLILKAAIEQARKEGATHIAISDAETAMMTEGHDLQTATQTKLASDKATLEKLAQDKGYTVTKGPYEKSNGLWEIQYTERPTQEPGMRLNYDTILPKIAEELTGSKGERVSLGEHKNAYDDWGGSLPHEDGKNIRSNLIFRNPDGTPKTDVTARIFALDKAKGIEEPFSYFEKRSSKEGVGLSRTEGETTDNSWKSFIPAMASTFDKVERVSKPHAEAARRYEARKDNYTGKGNVALQALERYGRNDVNRVMQQHREAYRNGTEPVLTGKDDKAISAILSNYYGSIADARRELGIRINNREAGKNEYYVPDMMNAETLNLFINHPQSPEALAAKEAWAEHVSNQSEGELTIDKVRQDINEYIEALKGQKNNYRSLEFGAIRRAAGYGLPESMRDTDAINTLARYSRRAAADLAFFQEIQSKPEIAGPLHIKNQYGEVYPGYKDSTLSQTDEIQNMMQWITGNVSGKLQKQPRVNAVVRLVNNSLLGPATGVRDLVSVPTHALPYISRLSDIKAVWDGLLDVRKNAVDSLAYAAKQPSIDRVQFNDVLDAPDRVSTVLNKAADLMRKAQGREALENFSRDVTFSIGKELGRNNILAAKAGDKKALSWLEKFGTLIDEDVMKLQGEELEKVLNQIGKNFTDRNQGTYGGRGLPLGVVDSSFAPFLSLQKWSIEKANTIYKDVYKPFITGENRLPMLTYTLGSIMTGAAIQQLNELMSNRKPNDPTVKEALDKGDAASIATEMATLMQLGSYAGIVSDGLKMLTDTTIRGKTPRNIVSFPTASAAVRTEEAVTNMLEAIRQGENPWDVLKAFTLDMAVNNVQTARLVANRTWKDEDVERSDKFRDMRIFGELEGKPAKDFTPTNPYLGLKQKKFKRTGDVAEAARLAPELVKDAVSGAKNSGELKSSLRGLKANSYQTFPSPEERPEEFLKYYNYLIRTQGKKNADERLMDYFRQRSVNKVKSEMIP